MFKNECDGTDGGAEEDEEMEKEEDEGDGMKGEDENEEGTPGRCVTECEVKELGGKFVIRGSPALALARKWSPEPGKDDTTTRPRGGEGESEMVMMGAEAIACARCFIFFWDG